MATIKAEYLIRNKAGYRVPPKWLDYVCGLAAQGIWQHYYLREAYQVLELLGHSSLDGMKILEPGCGGGIVGVLFSLMGADVVLMDNSPKALKEAQKHADHLEAQENITYLLGDLFYMPFQERTFDLVWNDGVIEHFSRPVEVVERIGNDDQAKGECYCDGSSQVHAAHLDYQTLETETWDIV